MEKIILFLVLLATTPTTCQIDNFLSIDCGLDEGAQYIDGTTGITYTSDASYIDAGTTHPIDPTYVTPTLARVYGTLRSFPGGGRSCYGLKPVRKGSKYLVRAYFMYGNYDGKNSPPAFDLYVGVERLGTVNMGNESFAWEAITVAKGDGVLWVCLADTGGGTPVVSGMDLRPLDSSMYQKADDDHLLLVFYRGDVGNPSLSDLRYPDDQYDRIWKPLSSTDWQPISTAQAIDVSVLSEFKPPQAVMKTAVKPVDANDSISFNFADSGLNFDFLVIMYFAEVEVLPKNDSRVMNISVNSQVWYNGFEPGYLLAGAVYSTQPLTKNGTYYFDVIRSNKTSRLPPIFNALEIFVLKQILLTETIQQDVEAMLNIKEAFGIKGNWMGDPCVPSNYSWEGLGCTYALNYPPTITSLNFSLSGLKGEIPFSLGNLTFLISLDLSKNNLTGFVPEFLADMPSLTYLNLRSNHFTGPIPKKLLDKQSSGDLTLRIDDNLIVCSSEPCLNSTTNASNTTVDSVDHKDHKTLNRVIIPIVASFGSVIVLVLIFITWRVVVRRGEPGLSGEKTGTNPRVVSHEQALHVLTPSPGEDTALVDRPQVPQLRQPENRWLFSYKEIRDMTNNFQRVVGKGGFGTVYHGCLKDGTQVAVKIIRIFSLDGAQDFKTEAELLMKFYHGSLITFIGYCDEGNNKAIIYEYMTKGNLRQNLSEGDEVLSWPARLQIAVNSAQGLEYLHKGCKPAIIHRDVKTTNILLDDNLQAKISDFGFSKVYPDESVTSVWTRVLGTPGYLDPEYHVSHKLNEKSDVYSFGVVLLELITGKLPIFKESDNIVHIISWVENLIKRGEIMNIVDPKLEGYFDKNVAWKALEVAMGCVQRGSSYRPSMSEILTELKQCLASENHAGKSPEGSRRREKGSPKSNSSVDHISVRFVDPRRGPSPR